MILTIALKDLTLSRPDRAAIEALSHQLDGYFRDIISARWNLSRTHQTVTTRCSLHSRSGYYRAQASGKTIENSLNLIWEKLAKQRRRKKEIRKTVRRRSAEKGRISVAEP